MVGEAVVEAVVAVAAAGPDRAPGAIGLGWRPELADILLDDGRIGFSEVIAEAICCGLPEPLVELRALDVPVITHGVSLSIASPDALDDRAAINHLRDVAYMLDSPVVSEHIAFTRTGRRPGSPHDGVLDTGHLLAPPLTRESARVVAANAHAATDIVQRPFVLENIASTMDFAESRWGEADYFDHLGSISDVGFILDVSNILAAASVHGTDPTEVIDRYPLERVAYLHVGGGVYGPDRFYRDTHTDPVHNDAWSLLGAVLANPRLRHVNVLLEWDGNYRRRIIADEIEALANAIGDAPAAFPRPSTALGQRHRQHLPRRRRLQRYCDRLDSTVRDLMTGRTPSEFGTAASQATATTLWGKRFFEAAAARPRIREIPDARTQFFDYANTHPHRISAEDDADAFEQAHTATSSAAEVRRRAFSTEGHAVSPAHSLSRDCNGLTARFERQAASPQIAGDKRSPR